METQTTYTIEQLKKMATQMNYKFACLFDNRDKKVNNFNTMQTPISKQFVIIENRLKSPALPDGIYFVGMCEKYGRSQIIDKYPIVKGSGLSQQQVTIYQPNKLNSENVLSYDSALQMQRDIARLENENHFLTENNKLLQQKISELEKELKETEANLSEYEIDGQPKKDTLVQLSENVGSWLKDIAPMITPIADRYFDLQEKKISLEEKKVDAKKSVPPQKQNNNMKQKKLEVGSPAFLDYIRKLHKEGEEEELNKCLDLLEEHFPQQYLDIGEELNLFEAEGEEEQNNG